MSTGFVTLRVKQGVTKTWTATIEDDGTPVDLTGKTYAGQIRKNIGDSEAVASFTCTVLDQVSNTGEFTFTLSAAASSAINLIPQRGQDKEYEYFVFDIEETVSGSVTERIIDGKIAILPETTK